MRMILGSMIAVALAASACQKGADSSAAVAKIQDTYAKRAQISDGWLAVMEQNAADPAAGLQKGAEYVTTNAPVLSGMATDLCGILRANQGDTSVRNAFVKVNEDVKNGMEAWKVRAKVVNEKYAGQAPGLTAQYSGLNSAFFDTAKACLPQ